MQGDAEPIPHGDPICKIWAIAPAAKPHEFSLWLDTFRWIAAVFVVICHASGLLMINYTRDPHHGYFHLALSFAAGFAYFAVVVFFVLSGYLVGGAFWSDIVKQRVNVTHYFLKRILRLWIVLIPSLALTFTLAELDLYIFPAGGYGLRGAAAIKALSAGTAVCNAAFLQYTACEPYGLSVPLWSLAHEFWYYVAFPFFALGLFYLRNRPLGVLTLMTGASILGIITYYNSWHAPIALYFLLWTLGVVAAVAKRPIIKNATLSSCLFVVITVFLRIVPVVFHYPQSATNFDRGANYFFPFDLLVAASFANMLVTLKHSADLESPPGTLVNRQLSGFSFSLYCIHFPVLYLVAAISMRLFGAGFHYNGSDYEGVLLVSAGVMTAIATAFLFSCITEAHTDTVRTWMISLIEPNSHREKRR